MFVDSRMKAINIIGQRKPFCRQIITEFSSAKKETFEIDILIPPIRITSRPPTRIRKWKQCQFRWTTTKIITIEDLSWLQFNVEPRYKEWKQVRDQQSYISVFVVYLAIPSTS